MTKPKREKWQKEKEQRERRTPCPGVRRKMIAHDLRITEHGTLLSKAIRVVSIDRPRKMWKADELTGSRLLLLQFSTFRSHDK